MQGSKKLRGKSWQLCVSDGFDVNGKRIRHTKTLKPVFDQKGKLVSLSSAEADNELRDFIKDVQSRFYSGKMTVSEYLDYWYKTFIDPEKLPENAKIYKIKTKKWYKMNIEQHLKPSIGKILLKDLTPLDIKMALNEIASETGNEKVSIDGIYRTLRAALECAVGTMLETNPAKNKAAKPPKATKRENKEKHQVFTFDQALRFLETAHRQWETALGWIEYRRLAIYAVFYTALFQAMRQGELLGLRWSDIDFENFIIDIKQQLIKGGRNPVFDTPKTENSFRQIRMAGSVANLLKELQHYQELTKKEAIKGKKWKDFGLVFCQETGFPLSGNDLNRRHLKNTINLANQDAKPEEKLPVIRFHDLRGSTATLLRELGEDPWTIASICGHTPQVSLDHYIHDKIENQDQAMEKLDQKFKEKIAEKSQKLKSM